MMGRHEMWRYTNHWGDKQNSMPGMEKQKPNSGECKIKMLKPRCLVHVGVTKCNLFSLWKALLCVLQMGVRAKNIR